VLEGEQTPPGWHGSVEPVPEVVEAGVGDLALDETLGMTPITSPPAVCAASATVAISPTAAPP
jgi:hypothetical protein